MDEFADSMASWAHRLKRVICMLRSGYPVSRRTTSETITSLPLIQEQQPAELPAYHTHSRIALTHRSRRVTTERDTRVFVFAHLLYAGLGRRV